MDLWIRSQDKTILIEANNLLVNDERVVLLAKTGGRATIGKYKTRERALEVLDEIQELIKPKIITTQYQSEIKEKNKFEFDLIMNPVKTEIQELSTYIYEMPEE